MYGVTHDAAGNPRIIEPKTVKVGFGLPKGPAIYTYITRKGERLVWVVVVGSDSKTAGVKAERAGFSTKEEAQKFYSAKRATAPERKYPGKLQFFTLYHVSPSGEFEPDWDVIEAHGPTPTEIDIVCLDDDPFRKAFQMWTAAELKCTGDGITAMRINSMATNGQKKLAEEAARAGERMFPIVNGCWTKGCPYSQPQGNEKSSACKPHGRFLFQLLNSPRLGSTAYFDTTGFRSISQIFSCLEKFKSFTGRGDPEKGHVAGIPLKMVLRPYQTSHNGQRTTQYGVYLEFRAESALALKRLLMGHSEVFRTAEPARLMEAPAAITPLPTIAVPETAAVIASEFSEQSDPAETAGAEQGPPPTDDEDYGDGPGGELGEAWEETAAETPAAADTAPTAPQPATSDPRVGSSHFANLSERGRGPKWRIYYELCRAKGMNDVQILQELGVSGYEKPEEVPEKAYPELMRRAEAFKATQGTLL
jgi:hypothetical protein